MKKIESRQKGKYCYDGIEYDSKEEIYFSWYLEELEKAQFIADYLYQPEPFQLSEPVHYTINKTLKTKVKRVRMALIQGHSYQPDFFIWWTPKAKNIYFTLDGNKKNFPFVAQTTTYISSHVDVKPVFDMQNMTRQFIINQKWTYQKYGIFVQKVVPIKLFKSTFTPERYLFTDGNLRPRRLDFKPKTRREFENGCK